MNNAVSINGLPPRMSVRGRALAPLSTDCTVFDRLLPTETLLFSDDTAAAGTFACATSDPLFSGGMPSTAHCIVFSRTAVWIQHEGAPRYVADPTVVTFHSRGRAYRRWRVSNAGDRCDWIAVRDDVVRDTLRAWSPAAADADRVRFPHQYAVAPAPLYARQRRMFDRLARGECDGLTVEETASALLRGALASAFRRDSREAPRRASQDAVQHAREIIARDPGTSVRLAELAHRVGLSPFQLCRAFVRVCGETMTAYRLRLRLLASLDPLAAGRGFASIAPPPGVCSHRPLTSSVRRAFGAPPPPPPAAAPRARAGAAP